ncbi:MAG: NUDIX domain-containing protein [Pseudomonadota bacterium]|nr:NUDIX domain-containing protein [Pseudomonadota bacterium]
MENLLPVIRNAARALIVRDKRVLLLRKEGGPRGERFALPGGAQDPGETLEQALERECIEEIGTGVEIQDLLHVADYFRLRDTVPPSTKHLVEFLFLCTVPDTYIPVNGSHPDKHQVEVVWTRLAELDTLPLFPRSLASYLQESEQNDSPVYLGLID